MFFHQSTPSLSKCKKCEIVWVLGSGSSMDREFCDAGMTLGVDVTWTILFRLRLVAIGTNHAGGIYRVEKE